MSAHNTLHEIQRADSLISDPGNAGKIACDKSPGLCNLVTGASGETRTLIDPSRAGAILALNLMTDGGGDCVITAQTAINSSGNTVITLNDAGDTVTLIAIPSGTTAFRWRVLVNDGASLS